MPTVEENLKHWNTYNWPAGGDEWSEAWGSASNQWSISLYPRVGRWLPSGTILEIAPGFGRWTQFLVGQCEKLVLVDLSPKCIEACRQRFGEGGHVKYHVNDGQSLDMVEDNSVDFVFSMDSLVHAEPETMAEYVRQLGRKLRPGGAGFLHHSNAGSYPVYRWRREILKKAPVVKPLLSRVGYDHWRSLRMSHAFMADRCREAGMQIVAQELIPWYRSGLLIDCLTTFAKPERRGPDRPAIPNHGFMKEARLSRFLSEVYRTQPGN